MSNMIMDNHKWFNSALIVGVYILAILALTSEDDSHDHKGLDISCADQVSGHVCRNTDGLYEIKDFNSHISFSSECVGGRVGDGTLNPEKCIYFHQNLKPFVDDKLDFGDSTHRLSNINFT